MEGAGKEKMKDTAQVNDSALVKEAVQQLDVTAWNGEVLIT